MLFSAVQNEVQEKGLTLKDYLPHVQERVSDRPKHKDNPFGISVVGDGEEQDTKQSESGRTDAKPSAYPESVDELAAKLKDLQN